MGDEKTMKKIKFLFSTVDQSKYVFRGRHYFKEELARQPDVQVHFVEEGGNIKQILKELEFTPDFIFIDDLIKNKPLLGLDQIEIPKGLQFIDIQKKKDLFRSFVAENQIDLVFSHYRDTFLDYYPELANKFRWFPAHVSTTIFQDYHLKKTINYLLMGEITEKLYPLRFKIAEEMKQVKGFVHHKHPGRRNFEKEEKALVGKDYAKEINRAKIFFTDDSAYGFPVVKYFEVAACKSLLLATGSPELRDLGFVDQDTFVEINGDNYLEKAEYYLKNKSERKKIAKRGYKMVRARHTTEIRVREFIETIRKFLYGN